MLEQWLVWERDLFFALNGSDFEWLDRVMWIYTGKMVWLPLAALILFLLFSKAYECICPENLSSNEPFSSSLDR